MKVKLKTGEEVDFPFVLAGVPQIRKQIIRGDDFKVTVIHGDQRSETISVTEIDPKSIPDVKGES